MLVPLMGLSCMGTYKTDMPLFKVSAFFWVDYFLFLSEKDNRPRTTILAVVPHAHAHAHTQAAPPALAVYFRSLSSVSWSSSCSALCSRSTVMLKARPFFFSSINMAIAASTAQSPTLPVCVFFAFFAFFVFFVDAVV